MVGNWTPCMPLKWRAFIPTSHQSRLTFHLSIELRDFAIRISIVAQVSSTCHFSLTLWKPDTRNVLTVSSSELPHPVSGSLLRGQFSFWELNQRITHLESSLPTVPLLPLPYPTKSETFLPIWYFFCEDVWQYDNVHVHRSLENFP